MEPRAAARISRLRLFGYPSIENGGGALSGPASQRHRLALLALLAMAPGRTLPRDKILALLWPDADTGSARHLLNTCVHVIRRAAQTGILTSSRDELTLSADVTVDVLEFQSLLSAGEAERAIELYTAPFLDAFFVDSAVEFDQWASRERSRLASQFRDALESLAVAAESRGDLNTALRWWRALNLDDPYNTRVVVRQMVVLERLGDHGNAIELSREHETVLARDLEAEAPAEFRELVQRLRDHPNGITEPSLTWSRPNPPDTAAHAEPLSKREVPRAPMRHRYRRAAVFAGIAALLLAVMFATRRGPLLLSSVLIGTFENTTGDPALDAVGNELRDLLIRDASQWSRIRVALPERMADRASIIPRLVRRDEPGTLIDGTYSRTGDSIRFDARVIERRRDRVRRVVSITLPVRGFPADAMQRLAERVMGALAMVVDERFAAVSTPDHAAPTFLAYQEFAIGLEMHGRADHVPAIDHLRRAVAADSTFTLAMAWLVRALDKGAQFRTADSLARVVQSRPNPLPDADRYCIEWLSARYRGDMQSAYRAARSVAELTPGSPWVLTYASEAANLRRPAEAHRALVDMAARSPWIRDWTEFVSALGYALHLLGRYNEEHELTQRNRSVATNLFARLIAEARPLAAMGRADDIKLLVAEALATADQPNLNEGSLMQRAGFELNAHGYQEAARDLFTRARMWYEEQLRQPGQVAMYPWALANTLLNLGEVDSAGAIYQSLHERLPRMYRFQGDLLIVAAWKRDVARYAYFDSLLAAPDSSWNIFDSALRVSYRARAAALLGDTGKALQLVQAAVSMGVPEPLDSVHIHPDLHVLRNQVAFRELARIRR